MRGKLLLVLLVTALVGLQGVQAEPLELPCWGEGTTYYMNQTYSGSAVFNDPAYSGEVNALITSTSCPFVMSHAGDVARMYCMDMVQTYFLDLDCPVTATGHAMLTLTDPPLNIDANFRLSNATVTGSFLIGTQDLNVKMLQLNANGGVELELTPGVWIPVGTGLVDVTLEPCPGLQDFVWPLPDSDTNSYDATLYAYGSYEIHLNVFGIPFDFVGDFAPDTPMVVALTNQIVGDELMGGCLSRRVNTTDTEGVVEFATWYCPDSWFYSRKELLNLNLEGFSLDSAILETVDYTLVECSSGTPTPTPLPTATPTATPTSEFTATPPPPTNTPTPVPTNTPAPGTPTATPTAEPEPTNTPGPEPTATPVLELGVRIEMPTTMVHPGDEFYVTGLLDNPGAPMNEVPVFFILDIFAQYYFWPNWKFYDGNTGSGEIDFQYWNVQTGTEAVTVLPTFTWPDTGSDSISGVNFYGAMLNDEMTAIVGNLAMVTWGFGPQ